MRYKNHYQSSECLFLTRTLTLQIHQCCNVKLWLMKAACSVFLVWQFFARDQQVNSHHQNNLPASPEETAGSRLMKSKKERKEKTLCLRVLHYRNHTNILNQQRQWREETVIEDSVWMDCNLSMKTLEWRAGRSS